MKIKDSAELARYVFTCYGGRQQFIPIEIQINNRKRIVTRRIWDMTAAVMQENHPERDIALEFERAIKERNTQWAFFGEDLGPVADMNTFYNKIVDLYSRDLQRWPEIKKEELSAESIACVRRASEMLMNFYVRARDPLPSAAIQTTVSFNSAEKMRNNLEFNKEWFKTYCTERKPGEMRKPADIREKLNEYRRKKGHPSCSIKSEEWHLFIQDIEDNAADYSVSFSDGIIKFGTSILSGTYGVAEIDAISKATLIGREYLASVAKGATTLEELIPQYFEQHESDTDGNTLIKAGDFTQYVKKMSSCLPDIPELDDKEAQKEALQTRKQKEIGSGTAGKLKIKRRFELDSEIENQKWNCCKKVKQMLTVLNTANSNWPTSAEQDNNARSTEISMEEPECPSFQIYRFQPAIFPMMAAFVEMGSRTEPKELTQNDLQALAAFVKWYRSPYGSPSMKVNHPELLECVKPNEEYLESSTLWKLAGYLYWNCQDFQDYVRGKDQPHGWKLTDPAYLPDPIINSDWYGVPKDTTSFEPIKIERYSPPKPPKSEHPTMLEAHAFVDYVTQKN